jgi:hypothetical protein
VSTRNFREGLAARIFPVGLAVAVVGFGAYFDHASSSVARRQEQGTAIESALVREDASPEVRRVAQWVVATQDAGGLPFVVVDKVQSRIFAFDPQGQPTGNAAMQPEGGVSPSGRFVADPIASARSGAIVWANAGTQLTVRSLDEGAPAGDAALLQVEPAFWIERLAPLRTQSVAYVLPRSYAVGNPS